MPQNHQKENRFLRLVKYTLPIFTILISACFILFIVLSNKANFLKEAQSLRKDFIASQKLIVKHEVEKIHNQILIEKKVTQSDLRNSIRQRVHEAYAIAYNIFKKYRNTHSEEEILKLIKQTLKDIRFNDGRGYYFIYNTRGVNLMHPINREIEGKNHLELRDIDGNLILKEFLPEDKIPEERFSTWYWYKPFDTTMTYKKIGFHKYFEPFGFYIATGEYLVDFEAKTKTILLEKLQDLTYGKNGSISIIDYDGNYLSHVNKRYVGVNRINLEDENGFLITKGIINTAINGEGFISYIQDNGNDDSTTVRTSYVKGFNDWHLAIESGFDESEVEDLIAEKAAKLNQVNSEYIQKIIVVAIAISIMLFSFSLYLSRILERYFVRYRTMLIDEAKKVSEKDQLLAQQSKMAALGEMLENIAHQWRQPLSVITTSASGIKLEKQLKQLKDEDEDRYLDTILTNAKHLSQTIDDFREFLKSDKSKEDFTLEEVFDIMRNLLSAKFKNSHIELFLDVDNINIYGLKNELIQVLMNIFNNSFDAFEQSEIDKRLIFVSATKKDNDTFITVKDSAGGIPEEILNRVFEPYFTTKHQYSGTGIGLYMSREIVVKNMHGTINVQNVSYEHNGEVCQGAQFEIMLKYNSED